MPSCARVPELAVELLGKPTFRAGHEWRWGCKSSLSVVARLAAMLEEAEGPALVKEMSERFLAQTERIGAEIDALDRGIAAAANTSGDMRRITPPDRLRPLGLRLSRKRVALVDTFMPASERIQSLPQKGCS